MNLYKSSVVIILTLGLAACQQSSYKEARTEVMALHDSVMNKNDKVVHLEMKIDTLVANLDSLKKATPSIDTAAEHKQLSGLLKELQGAEDSMNAWMSNFEPDAQGKSDKDALAYFNEQKGKIAIIDSLYNVKIKESEAYLSKFRRQ